MGASESTLSNSSLRPEDQITTVSQRTDSVDPVLERLNSLNIATPLLNVSPTETSLTELLVKKPLSSSVQGPLGPMVVLELFSMYRDWQEKKTQEINEKQEEIENKIEVADALAVKLLQRFNYSVSSMKMASRHLSEVQALQVEIGELKGRLTEVISNCDAMCKRVAQNGPESLQSSIKPLAATIADIRTTSSPSLKALDEIKGQ